MSLATQEILVDTLHNARIALFYKDAHGRYGFVNESGRSILGASADQILGRDDYAVFAPRSADVVRLRDQHVLGMNGPLMYESQTVVLGDIQPTKFVSVKCAVRSPRGHVTGLIGLSITQGRSPEAVADARLLMSVLVTLRTEGLLNICRRGMRLALA